MSCPESHNSCNNTSKRSNGYLVIIILYILLAIILGGVIAY